MVAAALTGPGRMLSGNDAALLHPRATSTGPVPREGRHCGQPTHSLDPYHQVGVDTEGPILVVRELAFLRKGFDAGRTILSAS